MSSRFVTGGLSWARKWILRATVRAWEREQSEVLERMLREQGLRRPADYRNRVDFIPRNPDLTAFHPQLGWRFVEVKVNRDPLEQEQLQTLAFWRDVVPGASEVVRLVRVGTEVNGQRLECSYSIR